MKRIVLVFAYVLMVLFFASCAKEVYLVFDSTANVPSSGESSEDEGDGPVPLPDGRVRMYFKVVSPWEDESHSSSSCETRTSWDGSNHAWSEGDEVKIFWGTGEDECVTASVVDGRIAAEVAVAPEYYACYPANGAFALRENGQIDFGIANRQYGSFADANMMVARASGGGATFHFKNVTHIVKFTITNTTYPHFRFSSNNGAIVSIGTKGVRFTSDDAIAFVDKQEDLPPQPDPNPSRPNLVYTNSRYATVWALPSAGTYYYAIHPTANYSDGFGVTAQKMSSDNWVSANTVSALSRRALCEDARTTTITNLGTITPMLHQDWFFSPSGKGKKDGSSWDDAGDVALFINLIGYPTPDGGVNSTRRLHNAKLHFTDGIYNLQAAALQAAYPSAYTNGVLTFGSDAWSGGSVANVTSLDGGYDPASTGTDLSLQRTGSSSGTFFTCEHDSANDRIFHMNGCTLNDWTFSDIQFRGTSDSTPRTTMINTRGVCFAFESNAQGSVVFNQCVFKNCYTNASSSGAAIYVTNQQKLLLSFNNCLFTSLTSGISFNSSHAESLLSFTSCTFDYIYRNERQIQTCGALYLYRGTCSISNCSFSNINCYTGGALNIGQNGILNVSESSFNGNRTSFSQCALQGGAILNNGNLTMDYCTVEDFAVSRYGGAILSGGTTTLRNCIIRNNVCIPDSDSGICAGAGIYFQNGNLTIRSSLIANNTCETSSSSDVHANQGGGVSVSPRNNSHSVFIDDTEFYNNVSRFGSALAAMSLTGSSYSSVTTKVVVMNCLMHSNTSSAALASSILQGGTVMIGDRAKVLIANSTIRGNTDSGSHSNRSTLMTYPSSNSVVCLFSSTLADNTMTNDVYKANNSSKFGFYNSIVMGAKSSNVSPTYSICDGVRYSGSSSAISFGLGSYSNGVYPLDATYSSDYSQGMTTSNFMTAINSVLGSDFLTSEQQALLNYDQKGNERTSTIMGAYVLTTAPSE